MFTSSHTIATDGDDDEKQKKNGSNQDPLQAPDIGAVSGDYSSPPDMPIPGQDDKPDSSRL